jgi:hypothetical protein
VTALVLLAQADVLVSADLDGTIAVTDGRGEVIGEIDLSPRLDYAERLTPTRDGLGVYVYTARGARLRLRLRR